jgi:hypothetical protein
VPASIGGSVMFSRALSTGIRLNAWKTKPSLSRRSAVNRLSSRFASSWPSTTTEPDVGRSSPASRCMSVDLPEPDGPMIAVNSPAGNAIVTPRNACTAASPSPY